VKAGRLAAGEGEPGRRRDAGVWSPRALVTFYAALAAFVAGLAIFVSSHRRPAPAIPAGREAIRETSPPPARPVPAEDSPIRSLARRRIPLGSSDPTSGVIGMPIEGLKATDLRDSFSEIHSGHRHEAIDILEPRGTPILAVDDGVIQKLFHSIPGGITIYQFDASGTFCYYYAHLERYAEGLAEGQRVRRGDRIGYVGTSGNAPPETPHLHFAVYRLGPERHWWQGEAVDPYPLLVRSKPAS